MCRNSQAGGFVDRQLSDQKKSNYDIADFTLSFP